MQKLNFPIQFKFKISSFSNDFTATDSTGRTIAYVKQKLFKLKEAITVYTNENKTDIIYSINADKWIDFSAAYKFSDRSGNTIGTIGRQGWASLWKAKYEIFDNDQCLLYTISEENGWVKVMDSLLGEIPILNVFTGYLFNPSYKVLNNNEQTVARLVKEPSFWGRNFTVSKLAEFEEGSDESVILGLMMMILLERRRG